MPSIQEIQDHGCIHDHSDECSNNEYECEDTFSQSFYSDRNMKSSAIPLPKSHIHRTESELELSENTALAEYRDQCMFNRLVQGIRKKQVLSYNDQKHKHNFRTQDMKPSYTQDPQVGCTFIEDNERSIKNIICTRTRRSSMENTSILNSSMHSVHLVDDDEDCGDFGQVFDIEM